MGGIAGLIRFDGQAIAESDTLRITKLLRHRGNVTSQQIDQGILLASGGKFELDKPAQIFTTVDADVFGNASPDQLFTTTYKQGGPLAFNELNADFAVAIWDANRYMLCLSRDAMGVKPLYYVHQPGRFCAFASEIKALLALNEVVVKPNKYKFREYLTWPTAYVPYTIETFYENIHNVLPGHYLQINAQKVTAHPYWRVNVKKYEGLNKPEDYSALFRDYFTTAVTNRIAGKKNVGSHLSGGLDSSSVSSIAQRVLLSQHRPALHTFNIDTEQPYAEEQEYVQAVVNQYATQHHRVRPLPDVVDSILKISRLFDQPEQFIIPSSFHLSVSVQAQKLGCDVLLTGHDGDSVIANCFEYLDQLFDADDWEGFQTASQEFITNCGYNLSYIHPKWLQLSHQMKLKKYFAHTITSTIKKNFRGKSSSNLLATLRDQNHFFGISPTTVIAYFYDRLVNKWQFRAQLDNAFTADFKQRFSHRPHPSTESLATSLSTDQYVVGQQILNTTNVVCNEQFNHIGAYYGHDYSFPFFDRNVIELGLATPLVVGFDHGRGRGLIRNGLRDILPHSIVERVTKANFIEYSSLSTRQLYEATYHQFSSPSHAIWEIIDRKEFAKILAFVFNPRMPMLRKARYNWLLSRIIYLALWLGSLPEHTIEVIQK
ncbi:asparagine synthetase B family protein [Spirosoma jeollabukense]